MTTSDQSTEDDTLDDTPPVLGSWRNIYIAVLSQLAILILLFYLLTRWAS